ncbi:MAG: hypothetical protein CL677_06565 [Bdellovibrionaceae bacterium]|nr:hypothetical protein [Pseudobdellovibrionaceae bacterium]|tara:strand:- start:49944 stop:50453 length:510 start_codon:yes stop_codon:yes gene_type:complete
MNESQLVILLLLLISILTGLDLVKDFSEGVSMSHVLIETVIIALCSVGVIIFTRKIQLQKKAISGLLNQAREDLQFWKEKSGKFIQGLSEEVDRQFSQWGLSKSEKEIALMLIKGFSTREIAMFRKTAEKTVRVQTSSIYKKAKVNNRNELTAFFLEDLLMPNQELENG